MKTKNILLTILVSTLGMGSLNPSLAQAQSLSQAFTPNEVTFESFAADLKIDYQTLERVQVGTVDNVRKVSVTVEGPSYRGPVAGEPMELLMLPADLGVGEYLEMKLPNGKAARIEVVSNLRRDDSISQKALDYLKRLFIESAFAQESQSYCNAQLQRLQDMEATMGYGHMVAGGMASLPGVGWIAGAIIEIPVMLGSAVLHIKSSFTPRVCKLAEEISDEDLEVPTDAQSIRAVGLPQSLMSDLESLAAEGATNITVRGAIGNAHINITIR